jgi:hypothetical protein
LSTRVKTLLKSPRSSSIDCEPCLMKRRSQVRIPPPPTLAWTCQKKKKTLLNVSNRKNESVSDVLSKYQMEMLDILLKDVSRSQISSATKPPLSWCSRSIYMKQQQTSTNNANCHTSYEHLQPVKQTCMPISNMGGEIKN